MIELNSFQTEEQDQSRAQRQEEAWNWVWLRRGIYFVPYVATLYVAVTPFWDALANFFYQCPWVGPWLAALLGNFANDLFSAWQSTSTFIIDQLPVPFRQLISCIVHRIESVIMVVVPPVLNFASDFLPSASKRWIQYYTRHSVWFALWAATIIGFWIFVDSYIENKINFIMKGIWRVTCHHGHPAADHVAVSGKPKNILYRMRTSDFYKRFISLLKQLVVPTLFAVLFLYVALTAVSVFWQAIQAIYAAISKG